MIEFTYTLDLGTFESGESDEMRFLCSRNPTRDDLLAAIERLRVAAAAWEPEGEPGVNCCGSEQNITVDGKPYGFIRIACRDADEQEQRDSRPNYNIPFHN